MSVFFTRRGKAASGVNYVGWLRSSGTQYINTGYVAKTNNLRIVVKFRYTSVASGQSLFGAQYSTGVPYGLIPHTSEAGKAYLYAGSSSKILSAAVTANTTNDWSLTAANGTATWKHNGGTNSAVYSGTPNQANPYFLFANNSGGSPVQFTSAEVELYQMYDDDVLVRDMRPCYDPNGVACLYDKVEEKYYYNAGTGEFVAGKTETGDFYWEKYAVGYDAVYTKTSWGQSYDLSVTRYLKKDLSVTMINGSPYWVGASMAVENYPQYPYLLSSTTSNRDTVMYGPLEHTVAAYKDAAKAPYKFTLTGATEAKGEYVATVHATKSDAYPDNGVQDGYWYVKVTQ